MTIDEWLHKLKGCGKMKLVILNAIIWFSCAAVASTAIYVTKSGYWGLLMIIAALFTVTEIKTVEKNDDGD